MTVTLFALAGNVAHRYEYVTVLQADMVGFTPLSASRGPQEVLSILGELFYEFDQQTEIHGVHKLKTIGDAYIVCCGAFGEAEEDDDEDEHGVIPESLQQEKADFKEAALSRQSMAASKLAKKYAPWPDPRADYTIEAHVLT